MSHGCVQCVHKNKKTWSHIVTSLPCLSGLFQHGLEFCAFIAFSSPLIVLLFQMHTPQFISQLRNNFRSLSLWVIFHCKSEGDHILYRNTVRAKIAEMGHLTTYCTCAVVAYLISTFLLQNTVSIISSHCLYSTNT